MKAIFRIFVVGLGVLWFAIGCNSNSMSSPISEIKANATELPTATSQSPTATNIPLTASPLPTTLPAIITGTAKQVLTRFVQENGGCKLPCILGLSPIFSNRNSVEILSQYFQTHSQESEDQFDNLNIDSYRNGNYAGVGLVFWKNSVRVHIEFGVSLSDDEIENISLSTGVYKHTGIGANEGAEILAGHPDYDKLLGQFSLPRILLDYGKPAEIWVRPFPEYLPDHPYASSSFPFDFVLIYPNSGFAVEYMARVKDKSDGYLIGCPNTSYTNLASWNPERKPQFAEIATYFAGTDSLGASNYSHFKQIQDATSLSVNDFYEHYKDTNFSECVKTPRSLWPYTE